MRLRRDIWLLGTLLAVIATMALLVLWLFSFGVDWEGERQNRAAGTPRSHLPEPGATLAGALCFALAAGLAHRKYQKLLAPP